MPTPSQISNATTVSLDPLEFDEQDARYMVFRCVHCQHAIIICATCGITVVLGVFSVCITLFKFASDSLVEVTALTGLTVFLFSGLIAHAAAYFAVKKQSASYLQPYLVLHVFFIIVEFTMGLTAVGELVTDSDENIDDSDRFARKVLEFVPLCIIWSSGMISVGVKYKQYLVNRLNSAYGIGTTVTPIVIHRPQTPQDCQNKPNDCASLP
uniref:MARVEL domain-containing protein n=1 Tax=Bursaphelenchus xylophilus TaxID=6326 RepID=A0A1I7RPJ5_BURXY